MKTRMLRGALGLIIGVILTVLNVAFVDGVLHVQILDSIFSLSDPEVTPTLLDVVFGIIFLLGAPIGGLIAGLYEDDWFEWYYIPLAALGGLGISILSFIIMIIIALFTTGEIWLALIFILVFASLVGGGGYAIVVFFVG